MRKTTRISSVVAILTLALTTALAVSAIAVPPVAQAQTVAGNTQNSSSAALLPAPSIDLTTVDDEGNTSIVLTDLQESLSPATGDLTDGEIASLLYMREEEKLAKDVYLTLYDQWGVRVFQNIANSEQTHMDAVKSLLDFYRLEDPAAGSAVGEFANADLQALYDQLIAQGAQSLGDALKVGAAIEEIDILDLEENLAEVESANIRTVYENLLKGSRNHLRSFTSTLSRQTGEVYEPQYMQDAAYQAIVGSTQETGGRGNGGNRNRS